MRRTKKFASFALAACMGVSLLVNVPAGTVSAAEPDKVVSGKMAATETDAEALDEAQEVVYDESKVDEDGFVWDGTTLVKYVGKGGDVKIPEGCTSIGGYYAEGDGSFLGAFFGCSKLTSIDIPSSVTSIREKAFSFCYGLTDIEIPFGVTNIGEMAFDNCRGLTSIKIPSGVTSIGTATFYDCSNLKSIEIPSSVTSIGDEAFYRCSSLTSIEIPSSVTSIGNLAFYGCSGLTSIYGYAGSYAETYAIANGYTFEDVEGKITTSYRTHVQSFGWQNPVTNGVMSGTSGKAKRLEGIEISVSGNKNLGIQYSTHCQTYGWLPWSANGEMNGTTGEAKRLEAIKIQLTGADKDKYDVYYRVHAQSYGWLGWAKNGEPSGTAGYAKRLEGIQIVVVKKNEKAPGLD